MRLLRSLALLALFIGSLPSPLGAAEPDCHEAWWRSRVDAVRESRRSVQALLPLRQALDASASAADPDAVHDALAPIARERGCDPFVRAEIERALLQRAVRRVDREEAATLRRALGLVERFWLTAPAPAPDASAREAAWASLGTDQRGWRSVSSDPSGLVALGHYVYPAERTSALLVFYLEAKARADVSLRLGADDRITVWVDETNVLARSEPHAIALDQQAIHLRLAPGIHRVTALVEQETAFWSFIARVTAPDGGPMPATVQILAGDDPRALERARVRTPPITLRGVDAIGRLEQAARGGNPRATAALALELEARSWPSRDDGRAVSLARQAAAQRPSDPDIEWVAVAVENDASRRREALVRMLDFHPAHPVALRELTRYHLQFRRFDEAREFAERANAACPSNDPAMEAQLAISRESRGFPGGALATLERIADKAPNQPLIWREIASLALRESAPLRARRALSRVLALDATDSEARTEAMRLAQRAGDDGAYRALILGAIAAHPNDPGARERHARFLLGTGDALAAHDEVERALAIVPGRPELLALRGEIEEALGRDDDAIASFTRARDGIGGDEALSSRIARATGDSSSTIGGEWRLSLDEARAIEAANPPDGDPAVVILHETRAYRVQSNGLGARFHQMIWRVRKPEQANFVRSFPITYSPRLQTTAVVEARVIRADGSVLLASRQDQPLLPDPEIRMWYDARVLTLGFPRLDQGDLIEICYVVSDRGPVNQIGAGYFGDIHVFGDGLTSLSSRLVLDAAPDRPLAHVFANLPAEPVARVIEREGRVVRVFDLPRLPSFPSAGFAPPATEHLPYAVVGTIERWEELGRLYAALIREQTQVSPDVRDMVATITRGATGRQEKLRRLYDWVIENTRYVALEFGIHALKPYTVESVFHRRHGDCKDKATLLAAMLREAGIESRIVLVRTRDLGAIDTSVPTLAHFNHAIVYVPEGELWLDGTVMHHALGETPTGDLDSLVLLVDPWSEADGRLQRTPPATPEQARVAERQTITFDSEGSATALVTVRAWGEMAARERYFFRRTDRPGRILGNRLRAVWPDANVMRAEFPAVGLDDAVVIYEYSVDLPRFALTDGDRLRAPIAFGLPAIPVDPPAAGRDVPLSLPAPFAHETTVDVVAPEGWQLAEVPRSGQIDSPWLSVSLSVERTRSGAQVALDLRFRGGAVPIDRLAEFAAAVVEAGQMLDQRIVFAKESR